MVKFVFLCTCGFLLLAGVPSFAQHSEVQIAGAMSNVMKKGLLDGTICLDTIPDKTGLYGLGPKAFLKGEILVVNGEAFVSSVQTDGAVLVEETYDVCAPFFVYAHVQEWEPFVIPGHVRTLKDLELYLDTLSRYRRRPFTFRLTGVFVSVDYHIQNLPPGTLVRSPKDAHTGQMKYAPEQIPGEVVGFFSTEHQSVFTHHDSYVHMHFISDDKRQMGHVDGLQINPAEVRLYLSR